MIQLKYGNKYVLDFLKHCSIDDVVANVEGELPELCTDLATYFYGNRELIVYCLTEEALMFFADTYDNGQTYMLVSV